MCLARLLLGEALHGRNSLWAKPAATNQENDFILAMLIAHAVYNWSRFHYYGVRLTPVVRRGRFVIRFVCFPTFWSVSS